MNRQISDNFWRNEFACKCGCGQDTVDTCLLEVLQTVRYHFNRPITVSSGNRCPRHNAREGGEFKSLHLVGRAADIVCQDVPHEDLYNFVDGIMAGWGGLILYDNFVHIDSRSSRMYRDDRRLEG